MQECGRCQPELCVRRLRLGLALTEPIQIITYHVVQQKSQKLTQYQIFDLAFYSVARFLSKFCIKHWMQHDLIFRHSCDIDHIYSNITTRNDRKEI